MNKTTKLLVLLCTAAPVIVSSAATSPGSAGKTNASTTITASAGAIKPAVTADNLFTNVVVAKGKGFSITRSDLDNEALRVKSAYSMQGQPTPPEQQILEGMIIKQLLLAKVTNTEKTKGREQFESQMQKFKTLRKLTDEEFKKQLEMQLQMMNLTREQWEKQNIEEAVIPMVLERELKVNVSEEDAQKFYDENPAAFEQAEKVRAAHVLISTRDSASNEELSAEKKDAKKKLAEDILKRAKAGEDFAKLAKEYSDDPGSKDSGGEYTFPRGQMVPEFENAAFSLETNKVSDIITTQFGYHIIKLYEKFPAKKEAYAGLKSKTVYSKGDGEAVTLSDVLANQSRQKQLKGYFQQLQKDAGVQILDDKLKPEETPALPDAPGTNSPAPAGAAKK